MRENEIKKTKEEEKLCTLANQGRLHFASHNSHNVTLGSKLALDQYALVNAVGFMSINKFFIFIHLFTFSVCKR